jgi:dephospho-CoA kinase
MLVIGLTGGIGSGKSTVARIFASLGAEIIDTDEISHQLTAPGQPAVKAIGRELGAGYIGADGGLDRAALRQLVFNDSAARKKLEDILHPRIRQRVAELLAAPSAAPYRIVVVPLLFETGAYAGLVQRTLVVDSSEQQQIERTMARSALTQEEVRTIMQSQLSRTLRLARADDVIVNDSNLENLTAKVGDLHKKYIRLA